MAKKTGNVLGGWAFLIGVVLALIIGVIGNVTPTIAYILVLVGLVIGLLNIGDEETTPFLMSGTVLIIASSLGGSVVNVVPILDGVLNALLLLFVPATVIVAVRHVFSLARR